MATIDEDAASNAFADVEVELVPVTREFVLQVGSILLGGMWGIWAANVPLAGGERVVFPPLVVEVLALSGAVVVFGALLFRGLSRALGDWGLEGGQRVAMFFLSLPGPLMAIGGGVWGWVHLGGR